MAKRFTDTEKWKKPLIRSMKAPYKLLWLYILDECDHAGIWQVDFEVAEIKIGEKLSKTDALKFLSSKIIPFDNGEKWFIPEFLDFQYGALNPDNRAHNSVLTILSRYGLSQENKPLTSTIYDAMDMDKDKNMDKDKDKGVKKKKDFEPPTVEQVIEYFVENGYSEISARKAHEYYKLGDWKDVNGKRVLAWKQKMHIVWFKPENAEPVKAEPKKQLSHQEIWYGKQD